MYSNEIEIKLCSISLACTVDRDACRMLLIIMVSETVTVQKIMLEIQDAVNSFE